MRLGIHGWRLSGDRTGVPRYLRSLVRRWDRQSSRLFSELTLYTPRPLAADDDAAISRDLARVVLPSSARMLVWENARLGPQADADVLFCPSYSRPLLASGRTVVTTHDMIFCVHPHLFPASTRAFYRTLYEWSNRHAALVITVAETVKAQIAHYWNVPRERIRVTYLAPAECFRVVDAAQALADVRRRRVGGDVPFFLFVGKTTGRRGLAAVMEGFARMKRTTPLPHRLVLVGAGTDGDELQRLAAKLDLADAVVLSGFLDDAELNLLYNAATALVSGARYETTSLPVMEAQATGLPVVCCRNEGMTEITGGAAVFLDTVDAASMAEAMIAMAEDADLRADLRARGLASAARFSWDRCARETMTALEDAASS